MTLARAEDLILAGDIAGAEELIAVLLNEEPRNAAAIHVKAMASLASGDLNTGIAILREAVNRQPDPYRLRDLGAACLANGQASEALPVLEQAFAASTSDPQLKLFCPGAQRFCRAPEAVTILKALEANSRVLAVLGEALFASGEHHQALDRLLDAAAPLDSGIRAHQPMVFIRRHGALPLRCGRGKISRAGRRAPCRRCRPLHSGHRALVLWTDGRVPRSKSPRRSNVSTRRSRLG